MLDGVLAAWTPGAESFAALLALICLISDLRCENLNKKSLRQPTMRALYLLIAVGAHNRAWALLDARSVLRGSNRRLSTANLGQLKLVASDASSGTSLSSEFGKTVAIDGETVVAGAYGDESYTGSAHVFRTTDGGATYDEMAKLTASDGAAGDWFGSSVAIAGQR